MAKQRRIKARVEINLSEDHLGLTRVFDELVQIEDANPNLSAGEVNALKRRYMLSILYKYSAQARSVALSEDVRFNISNGIQDSKNDAPAPLPDQTPQAVSVIKTPDQPTSANMPTKQEVSLAADKAIAAGIDANFQ
jgi:hypothetical protein